LVFSSFNFISTDEFERHFPNWFLFPEHLVGFASFDSIQLLNGFDGEMAIVFETEDLFTHLCLHFSFGWFCVPYPCFKPLSPFWIVLPKGIRAIALVQFAQYTPKPYPALVSLFYSLD
jgi:hypothetical protein